MIKFLNFCSGPFHVVCEQIQLYNDLVFYVSFEILSTSELWYLYFLCILFIRFARSVDFIQIVLRFQMRTKKLKVQNSIFVLFLHIRAFSDNFSISKLKTVLNKLRNVEFCISSAWNLR